MSKMSDLFLVIQEEVEWSFGDWPEGQGISSGDVSSCVDAIKERLPELVTAGVESDLLRRAVHDEIESVLVVRRESDSTY